LPSNAATVSGNASWPVSSPMVICGSRRRSFWRIPARGTRRPGRSQSRAWTRRRAPGWPARGGRAPRRPRTAAAARFLRVGRQAALDGAVGRRRDACLLQDADAVELADGLDDPRHHQLPEHVVRAGRVLEPEHPVGPLQRLDQVSHPGGGDRQRAARPRAAPRSSSSCPAATRCRAAAFRASSSASSCADPGCSIPRDPRRDDHTTCTAVAPDAVFTVRTYATRRDYGQGLVRKPSFREQQTSRSETRGIADRQILT
jgi:hypothetical protein